MEQIARKYRRGTPREFAIEHLKSWRKRLNRSDKAGRYILSEAIELLQADKERDDVSTLFHLWDLPDPRG